LLLDRRERPQITATAKALKNQNAADKHLPAAF
jgi:hypothetical protein